MKRLLFVIYLFLTAIAVGQSKNPATIPQIVDKLEQKFKVSIIYDADINILVNPQLTTRILSKNSVEKALKLLSKNTGLEYKKLRTDFYVLTNPVAKNNFTGQQLSGGTLQQKRVISGRVMDNEGNPLPGAVVTEKGTNNAVITDLDGKFTLEVSPKAKALVVTFVGFQKQEVPLQPGKKYYEIHMQPTSISLDAVVVSGVAGKTPRKKLTITVDRLDAQQLDQAPANSAATVLAGKLPGVVVTQPTGEPGSSSAIRMRGAISMLGRNAPLVIVDGIMVQTSLADINADDIESIEVVKGAAASALYGSRAAGGVIVITTKRGKNIKSSYQVTIRNEIGNTSLVKYVKLATHHPYKLADDWENYPYTKYEGVVYDDNGWPISGSRILTDSAYADQPYARIFNHQKLFFQKGIYYTNYASVASKAQKTNLFLSFENHHNQGIIFHTKGFTRRNFRFNADTRIGKFLKLSTSNLLINTISDRPGSNGSFFDLLFVNPDVDLTQPNEDGSPYKVRPDPWSVNENPLYPLYYRQRKRTKNSFMTDFKATFTPVSWFKIETKYTFEKLNIAYHTYTPMGYLYDNGAYINGSLYKEYYQSTNQTFQTTASFRKTFGGFHLTSKFSYMYESTDYFDFAVTGRDFLVPNIPQLNNTDPTRALLSSYQGAIRAIDFFAITDFDYKDKYLFSGLFRRDGSSLFGANERWHNYYRVAAAYRITQDFKIPGFQELKIRAAYGTSGLRPGFSWQYETWRIVSGTIRKQNLGNKNLKPAEARELEIAVDANFLKHFDFYGSYSITNTIGAFALAPLASHAGYSYQWRNVGNLRSKTWEFSLGWNAINNKHTNLYFKLNFDHIRQWVVSLTIPPYFTGPLNAYYIEPGQQFGILYGYTWLRTIQQMQNQLPDSASIDDYTINSDGYVIRKGTEGSKYEKAILYDADGDGNPDKVVIGNANPDFNIRFSTSLKLYKFHFYVLLDWKQGGDIYNYTHQYTFRDGRAIEFDQFGKPDNLKKSIYYYSWFYQNSINSYFVEDGTYLKIRELSAYLDINPHWLGGLVKSVRIGIVGHNVYTFTKYSGYDPEVAYSGDLTTFAFDYFTYPNFRTVTASIQVKF